MSLYFYLSIYLAMYIWFYFFLSIWLLFPFDFGLCYALMSLCRCRSRVFILYIPIPYMTWYVGWAKWRRRKIHLCLFYQKGIEKMWKEKGKMKKKEEYISISKEFLLGLKYLFIKAPETFFFLFSFIFLSVDGIFFHHYPLYPFRESPFLLALSVIWSDLMWMRPTLLWNGDLGCLCCVCNVFLYTWWWWVKGQLN